MDKVKFEYFQKLSNEELVNDIVEDPDIDPENDPDVIVLRALRIKEENPDTYINLLHEAVSKGSVRAEELLHGNADGADNNMESTRQHVDTHEIKEQPASYSDIKLTDLALLYRNGDAQAAFVLAEKSFEKGWVDECVKYLDAATSLVTGQAVRLNTDAGSFLYKIGLLYEKCGDKMNAPELYKKAYELFGFAGEQKYIPAYQKMADYLEKGKGCAKNAEQAMAWRGEAAKRGTPKDRYQFALLIAEQPGRKMEAAIMLTSILDEPELDDDIRQICMEAICDLSNDQANQSSTDTEPPENMPESIAVFYNKSDYDLQDDIKNENPFAMLVAASRCLNRGNKDEGRKYLDKAFRLILESDKSSTGDDSCYALLWMSELFYREDAEFSFDVLRITAENGYVPAIKKLIRRMETGDGYEWQGAKSERDIAQMCEDLERGGNAEPKDIMYLIKRAYKREEYYKAQGLIQKIFEDPNASADVKKSASEYDGYIQRQLMKQNAKNMKQNAGKYQQEVRTLYKAITDWDSDAIRSLLYDQLPYGTASVPLIHENGVNENLLSTVLDHAYKMDVKGSRESALPIIKMMLEQGADVNSDIRPGESGSIVLETNPGRCIRSREDRDLSSPFLRSVVYGFSDITELLLSYGARYDKCFLCDEEESNTYCCDTLASWCIRNNRINDAKMLVKHKCVSLQTGYCDTYDRSDLENVSSHREDDVLSLAILSHNRELIRMIIEAGYVSNNVLTSWNRDEENSGFAYDALSLSILTGDNETGKLLIDGGYELNHALNYSGGTAYALGACIDTDNLEMAAYMLKNGADPNVMEKEIAIESNYPLETTYNPLLFKAILFNNPDMIRLLLENNADINMYRAFASYQSETMIKIPVWMEAYRPWRGEASLLFDKCTPELDKRVIIGPYRDDDPSGFFVIPPIEYALYMDKDVRWAINLKRCGSKVPEISSEIRRPSQNDENSLLVQTIRKEKEDILVDAVSLLLDMGETPDFALKALALRMNLSNETAAQLAELLIQGGADINRYWEVNRPHAQNSGESIPANEMPAWAVYLIMHPDIWPAIIRHRPNLYLPIRIWSDDGSKREYNAMEFMLNNNDSMRLCEILLQSGLYPESIGPSRLLEMIAFSDGVKLLHLHLDIEHRYCYTDKSRDATKKTECTLLGYAVLNRVRLEAEGIYVAAVRWLLNNRADVNTVIKEDGILAGGLPGAHVEYSLLEAAVIAQDIDVINYIVTNSGFHRYDKQVVSSALRIAKGLYLDTKVNKEIIKTLKRAR